MPTYDYKCKACGHQFEQFQSMKDATLKKCPACGKNALERLIGTGAAVIFKGSGFYQTDYRSESYKKAAESDKKPAESASGEGKSKSEPAKAESGGAKSEPAKTEAAKPATSDSKQKKPKKKGD